MASTAPALCVALLLILLCSCFARPLVRPHSHLNSPSSFNSSPRCGFLSLLLPKHHHTFPDWNPASFSSDPEFFNEPFPAYDCLFSSVQPELAEELSHLMDDPEFFNDEPILLTRLRSSSHRTEGSFARE